MTPPATSFVFLSTPASFMANAFASAWWPSRRETKTGLSGVTSSITWWVGRRAGDHLSWSQFHFEYPCSFGLRLCILRDTLAKLGFALLVSPSCTLASDSPAIVSEMNVGIVEARHDTLSAELDDYRRWACEFKDVPVDAPYTGNVVAEDCEWASASGSWGFSVQIFPWTRIEIGSNLCLRVCTRQGKLSSRQSE